MCEKKLFMHDRFCPHANEPGPKPGYYYSEKNGYQVIRECDCHFKWRKSLELDAKLAQSNLFADYTFDDYRGTKSLEDFRAFRYLADHFEKYKYKKMFYLWGPNNTMKTSMAVALGKQLVEQGYTVQFTTMNDLTNSLVKTFDDPNQDKKEAFIKRCNDVDLLILDESFDKSKVVVYQSGWQQSFIDSFIRSRFEIGKKSTLFISNRLPNQIASEGFGESLQSLIERNVTGSLFKFEDKWLDNVNQIDRLSLFSDRG